ncbi:MAG: bifunctional homocysteine S-methyltransferase/methylenetetrahydrofolate reductase [Planctomycetota bacterium]|nr:bifunctional homocysteine S-methyltransferase/methylenetetrahydrofolate reductase [Planctomycetota bacterium]
MTKELQQRLAAAPLIADGAMGTMLYAKGVYINRCYDEVNLTQPDLVGEVHRSYVQAGAEVIETNTFGANPVKLRQHGLEEETEHINRRAAEIAVEAVGGGGFVVGAIGPLGIRIEPWGPTGVDEAEAFFRRQVQGLIDGGVRDFLLETFGDINEARAAMEAVRALAPDATLIVQMTVDREGVSGYGTTPEAFGARLDAWGADVIGVNCSVGPSAMLTVLEHLREATDKPLAVQPNAGPPHMLDDRTLYLCTPDYLGKYARRFVEAGARLLGGCCGTTPDHIRALAKSVKRGRATIQDKPHAIAHAVANGESQGVEPTPLGERSPFGKALAERTRPVLAELMPPKGCDPSKVLERAAALKEMGITGINIPDGARATARMSHLALGVLIHQQVGVPPVLHYCCRDRNILGMQADLLGASALGVHDLLIITGDPPVLGDYPDATAVFDVDAIGLTNIVSRLNHGVDLAGNPTGRPTDFVIGVGLDPTSTEMERELSRYHWKVDAGAEYAITQPVFDIDALDRFLDQLGEDRIPILAGIWPLASLRNAEFLNTEVPGVTVAESILERMAAAGDKEGQRRAGIDIAVEMIEAVRDRVEGIQVSIPFGRVEVVRELLDAVRV